MGLILALFLVVGGQADWPTALKPLEKQIARVVSLSVEEDEGTCTGVVLSEVGFLLTAAHCIPEKGGYSLTVNTRHAEVARINRILDLAVVRFDRKDEQPLGLAPKTPPAGTEVAVFGFGFGVKRPVPRFGHIAQTLNEETDSVWVDIVLMPGHSGGPVVDGEGRLVGLAVAAYQMGGSRVGSLVPVEKIRDFVESYLPAAGKK